MPLRAYASVIVLFAILSGCGSDSTTDSNGLESKSPDEILAASAKALRHVKSFHFESTDRTFGRVKADVGLPKQLRVVLKDKGSSVSLLVADGSFYLKGNAAYWRDNDAARQARVLADQWLKVPRTSLEDLTTVLAPKTLSRCLLIEHGTLERRGTTTVKGQRVVVLYDRGDRPGSTPSKLYVSATGQPVPLRLLTTGKQRPNNHKYPECGDDTPSDPGEDTILSKYNQPIHVFAPPDAIDLGRLGMGNKASSQ
jgi:hypothetical protein